MTIREIKQANAAAGFHFFDRTTMRFFHSRVEGRTYEGPGGIYFITSEQFHGSISSEPRKYTVRRFYPKTGDIDTVGKFNEIVTRLDARLDARLLAKKKS